MLDRFADHAGYSGVMLGLPGTDHHLEFTAHVEGTPGPAPTTENLLVLYIEDPAGHAAAVARLQAHHAPVPLDNPYWAAVGAVAFADPDGWRMVLAPATAQLTAPHFQPAPDVPIEPYTGPREELRGSFELAEDSPTELDSYLHAGRVLVARSGQDVLGHIQVVDTDRPGRIELKNMAVREAMQGRGVGSPARPGRPRPRRGRGGARDGGRHSGCGHREPALLPATGLPVPLGRAGRVRPGCGLSARARDRRHLPARPSVARPPRPYRTILSRTPPAAGRVLHPRAPVVC